MKPLRAQEQPLSTSGQRRQGCRCPLVDSVKATKAGKGLSTSGQRQGAVAVALRLVRRKRRWRARSLCHETWHHPQVMVTWARDPGSLAFVQGIGIVQGMARESREPREWPGSPGRNTNSPVNSLLPNRTPQRGTHTCPACHCHSAVTTRTNSMYRI